jgi:3-hydroxybutyryl-CoA dehydrogenase
MSLKKKILAECEKTCPPDTIFATNTSSLSITELANSAKYPQNVVGMK